MRRLIRRLAYWLLSYSRGFDPVNNRKSLKHLLAYEIQSLRQQRETERRESVMRYMRISRAMDA